MKRTIREGGDTDTNACIVGGLIGSIIGYKQLPKEYMKKLLLLKRKNNLQLTCQINSSNNSQKRVMVEEYNPSNGFVNLVSLLQKFIDNGEKQQ
jgi:hypothetical protein